MLVVDGGLVLGELGGREDVLEEPEACIERAALVIDEFGMQGCGIVGGLAIRKLAEGLDGLFGWGQGAKREHGRIKDEGQGRRHGAEFGRSALAQLCEDLVALFRREIRDLGERAEIALGPGFDAVIELAFAELRKRGALFGREQGAQGFFDGGGAGGELVEHCVGTRRLRGIACVEGFKALGNDMFQVGLLFIRKAKGLGESQHFGGVSGLGGAC